MNNYDVIKALEKTKDLTTNPLRLKDYIEMGQNIFIAENDFDEGKRILNNAKNKAKGLV